MTIEGRPEEAEIGRSPLLPDRHPTVDLFVCDIFDAAPKGDIAAMEHPIFSISTKPDQRIRRYEHGSRYVEITPSVKGLATVHDRDILIYCISQVIAGINANRPIGQTLRLKAHDLLTATNRTTSGEGYEGLKAALERLGGTRISTNITTGGEEVFENFGLIEKSKLVRQTREGRMQEVEIKLSDWVFNAIRAKEVLTLHKDYFRLRKPLERRMYELARKHCGHQDSWSISLELLQKKCGSNSTEKEFRRLVKAIVEQEQAHAHFPDYTISMSDDTVTFNNKSSKRPEPRPAATADLFGYAPTLDEVTFSKARKAAPGYDPRFLYNEWVEMWRERGSPEIKHPAKAFLGFCRKRHELAPTTR